MLALLLLALSSATLAAQCPARSPVGSISEKYQPRPGNRCEGRASVDYTTIGDEIRIVSVTGIVDPYDSSFVETLLLYWRPSQQAINIEAAGARQGVDYRMDVLGPLSSSPFKWPADVLFGARVDWSNLGVKALADVTGGGATQKVFVPVDLRLHVDSSSAGCVTITVKAVAGKSLTTATMSLTPLDSAWYPLGGPSTVKLPNGAYAAGSTLPFVSACLSRELYYEVEVRPPATATTLPARGYVYIP